MEIAIPLFHQLTALDCIGPYEVLQRLPGASVVFVAEERGEDRTENGFLGLTADRTFDEVPSPDVVVVPGGVGTAAFTDGGTHRLLQWVQSTYQTTQFTTSVCTGSEVLAASGLLDGLESATHWAAFNRLERLGVKPTSKRIVEHLDRRILTAAGVSSGIDMALRLAELLVDTTAAKAMQLMVEYDPQPPFEAGSVEKAGEEVMTRAIEYFVNEGS